MGLKNVHAVWASGLPATLRPVAMVHAMLADDGTGDNCRPGLQYVADALGLKTEIVRKHRDELIKMGVLQAETTVSVTRAGERKHRKVTTFCADKLPARRAAGEATVVAPISATEATAVVCQATVVAPQATAVACTTSTTNKHNQEVQTRMRSSDDAAASSRDLRSPSSQAAAEPTTRDVLRAFRASFVEKFGNEPHIDYGRDGAMAKTLVDAWGGDAVLEVVRRFFARHDTGSTSTFPDLFRVAGHLRLPVLVAVSAVRLANLEAAAIATGRATGRDAVGLLAGSAADVPTFDDRNVFGSAA